MHRNIQPFKRSGCPVLFSCFVRLASTKTVFVRSFISICLGFLYVITHTEKNSVATWWAIGISLSTRMCCNGNNSVRLCFTSSDRCAHFVAVRIHITYSKIHCFPNNHHIYWVCCVFFSPLVKNLDMFIFIHKLFVRTRNSDNEITMFFFWWNCSKQPAHTQLFNFIRTSVSNFARGESFLFVANKIAVNIILLKQDHSRNALKWNGWREKRKINHVYFESFEWKWFRMWKRPRYWKIRFWMVPCLSPWIRHLHRCYWFYLVFVLRVPVFFLSRCFIFI